MTVILGVLNTLQLLPCSGFPNGFSAANRILHDGLARYFIAFLLDKGQCLRVIPRLDRGAVTKQALGPPVLMQELILGGISIAVGPHDGEGDRDVGVVDRARGLVEAVHRPDIAVFAGRQGPGPLSLVPVGLEDLGTCHVSQEPNVRG